jgi:hypothetical protein
MAVEPCSAIWSTGAEVTGGWSTVTSPRACRHSVGAALREGLTGIGAPLVAIGDGGPAVLGMIASQSHWGRCDWWSRVAVL